MWRRKEPLEELPGIQVEQIRFNLISSKCEGVLDSRKQFEGEINLRKIMRKLIACLELPNRSK